MWQIFLLFRVKWEKIALKIKPLRRKKINPNVHKQTRNS